MGSGPAPFANIGKKAKGSYSCRSEEGPNFFGDITTVYKSGGTTVDVKVDSYSNVSAMVTVNDLLPSSKVACSFKIPDQKSGKLEIEQLHHHAAIGSSIGLNPTPLLELSAAIGSKDLALDGEIGFDTASASFTKCEAGIAFNKPDFSAALFLTNKGQALKASYIHSVNPSTSIAAEMTHRFSTFENNFTIGSSHAIDPFTEVKTRFSDKGKVAMLCQHEWRPKSLITVSAEYDSKSTNSAPKMGLTLALKP